MPKNLKILAYLQQYPPPFDGGAFHYNYHLFKELHRLGCKITILTHPVARIQSDDGIKVISVKSIKTRRLVYRQHAITKLVDLISNVLVMRKYLSNTGYDFIFSEAGYLQNLLVFVANLLTRIPVIGLNYGEEINTVQKTTRFRSWLQRRLLQSHYINICISHYTRDLLLACGVKKSIVILYPFVEKNSTRDKVVDRQFIVDTYDLNPESLIVGFLGRHTPRKGLFNLIAAVERLLQEKKQITLLIAGQGTETDRIKERISRSDHCSQLKMVEVPLGESKDRFFSGIDLFAMPNYEDPISGDTEGFGIVFIEAAQNGTPVIGGNAGGVVDAVHHQYNGFLVDGHCVNSIAEAISLYYRNPSLRELHGQNGKEWAKRFTNVNSFSSLLDVMREKNSKVRSA